MFSTLKEISANQKANLAFGLMAFTYLALCLFYNQPALRANSIIREVFDWLEVALLLFSYWLGYCGLKHHNGSSRYIMTVIVFSLIFSGLMLLTPPFHSTDIFGYLNRGWQQLHYGMNPYVYTIDDIPGWEHDPMITNHWVNNPSPYGALYLLFAKGLCYLGMGNKTTTVLIFKLSNLLAYGITAFLIWLSVSRLYDRGSAIRATYLYSLNPLILIHGLANGHNDILMGLLITLSAYMAIIDAWVWVLPVLVAATLIKYGSVVLIPFIALFLIHHKKWKALTISISVSAGLFIRESPFKR